MYRYLTGVPHKHVTSTINQSSTTHIFSLRDAQRNVFYATRHPRLPCGTETLVLKEIFTLAVGQYFKTDLANQELSELLKVLPHPGLGRLPREAQHDQIDGFVVRDALELIHAPRLGCVGLFLVVFPLAFVVWR